MEKYTVLDVFPNADGVPIIEYTFDGGEVRQDAYADVRDKFAPRIVDYFAEQAHDLFSAVDR